MKRAELEKKHIAELHALAAEAGVPRYRMLRREELIEKLADGEAEGERAPGARPERSERPPRRRRERPARAEAERDQPEAPAQSDSAAVVAEPGRPKRRRRRRRFGRRSKGLRVQDLLTPPPGRQALVYAEDRSACTALLREIAAELTGASEGPDPIALLLDPSPEELAEWKREAPDAELVVAAQARHAGDALAQAVRRADSGEDITLLVDSLTRLDDAELAKEISTQASPKLKAR